MHRVAMFHVLSQHFSFVLNLVAAISSVDCASLVSLHNHRSFAVLAAYKTQRRVIQLQMQLHLVSSVISITCSAWPLLPFYIVSIDCFCDGKGGYSLHCS